MRRCIMFYTGYVWREGLFKAFVFHILPYWGCPSETRLYTPQDKKRKKTNKQPHSILSELQYKYRFMHTMKASFPIVWLVSQHCYNALLCIWAIFFPHMNVRERKNKRCVMCSEITTATRSGHLFHLELDFISSL